MHSTKTIGSRVRFQPPLAFCLPCQAVKVHNRVFGTTGEHYNGYVGYQTTFIVYLISLGPASCVLLTISNG